MGEEVGQILNEIGGRLPEANFGSDEEVRWPSCFVRVGLAEWFVELIASSWCVSESSTASYLLVVL